MEAGSPCCKCKCISFCGCLQFVVLMLYVSCVWFTVFIVNELDFDNTMDNITDSVIMEYTADLDVVYVLMDQVFTTLPVIGLLAVYLWLPQLQNLQGKIVMSYLVCCAITRGSEAFMYVFSDRFDVYSFTFKRVMLPFGVAQFTWVTLMCFDISNTFSQPMQGPSHNRHTRQFLVYSLCGWGFPALSLALPSGFQIMLVLLTVVAEAVLCVMLFLSTLVDLGRHHFVTLTSRLRTHGNTAPDWLIVSLKLALLMIMDSSLFFLEGLVEFGSAAKVVDVFLAFQGTILFVLLVCNKRISGVIRKRFVSVKQQGVCEEVTTINSGP